MTFDPEKLVRDNIRRLTPYSSARSEFAGRAEIFLDANENPFGSPLARDYHRYPDPLQSKIKKNLAAETGLDAAEIFVGNGSDEAIDLLFRIFCEPGRDAALVCPPTYGMYRVSADVNAVRTKEVCLRPDFGLDAAGIREAADSRTKLLFICSPNNPTGNSMRRETVLEIVRDFRGIVVVDEAYIHFSREKSLVAELRAHPNLVVLQTFSKAWGLAGLRVGMAFASREIVALLNRVKPPYNVSEIAQEAVLDALENRAAVADAIAKIIVEREMLAERLEDFPFVERIYPSDANFLLVKTTDADRLYRFLLDERIVVRNRARVAMCLGCLRITVGTPAENARLLESLEKARSINL
ncbi:MAG: histidinol-phosphate transaminase [Acidobacteria bacterium]|nr:histidinol-phosphate transaminase [Acidobacteriota bacterium]